VIIVGHVLNDLSNSRYNKLPNSVGWSLGMFKKGRQEVENELKKSRPKSKNQLRKRNQKLTKRLKNWTD